jgi:Flp pilus assembly protein TadG
VSREGGTSTLEFALVLPLVLAMALALLQVGLLVKDQLIVVGAARAGAREAAVTTDEGAVRDAAIGSGPGLREERTDVQVSRSGGAGDPVTVTVRYAAPVVVPLVAWLFPEEVGLSAEATMRQETDGP